MIIYHLLKTRIVFCGFLALLILCYSASAVQNATFMPSTITLGDDIALSFDFEQSYQIADCRIYVDLNHSGTIDPSDYFILREKFWDNDGWDENPALHHYQRIFVPDEIHQIPAQYLARVEDGGTPAVASFNIIPISSSTSLSGTVLQPANTANLVAFLGITQGSGPPQSIYSALTNSSGEFTVSIPDSLSGRFGYFWVIDIADVATNWAVSNLEFIRVEGHMTGHIVQLRPIDAWVYGQIRNDAGSLLPDGYTIDASPDGPSDMGSYQGGWYHIGTTSGTWEICGENEQLRYDYMSAYRDTTLASGDSVRVDLIFCRANGTISGTVYLDGMPATRIEVGGSCSLGNTYGYSDMNGLYTLHISNLSFTYEVEINQDDIPVGYYPLEQYTGIFPGATGIDFHLVPIPGGVSGTLSVQIGDPIPDYTEFTAWAEQTGGGDSYTSVVAPDGSYEIRVPQGLYTLRLGQPFPPPYEEVTYLWEPQEYDSVQVGNTISPGYNYELNYANARVQGQLTGLTESQNLMIYGWGGVQAMQYMNAVLVGSDFHYEIRVCEGTWHLIPPYVSGYNVNPPGYTFDVTEDDTLFTGYNFVYTSVGVAPHPSPPIASEFSLTGCYPNPFNSSIAITYEIPSSGIVVLYAFDILGRKVADIYRGNVNYDIQGGATTHRIMWTPKKLSSGIYFLELGWSPTGGTRSIVSTKVLYLR